MKLIAFGASNSKSSINKKLATYAASLVDNAQIEVLDINDFDLPLFSEDLEKELGHPQAAQDFIAKISEADGLVISFAEHNGSYTAAYKNLYDWASRIEQKVYQNTPAVFLSTSPGPGGASSVLNSAVTSAQFLGAELKASLSLGSFYDKFNLETNELHDTTALNELRTTMQQLAAIPA
ncbi:NADPH-dependent FMN reductase [Pseudovibrio axinellae]|uniref:NADPH-dependent FMN reductase n=1 Tax=Pseudovibrio axinellae TaxID=989403 RepID=A0A166APF6_9HYPH|nr:NAD(P)H-dependent oxidoreductase [Pseudovibrio axinellae]KZL21381.1 NADPH-dependent FMN reductase [Pseudovibrio axinellae]SEQ98134.1 NAD(P)H-dependent FMN reductase [Pseudovibrio axinellae]